MVDANGADSSNRVQGESETNLPDHSTPTSGNNRFSWVTLIFSLTALIFSVYAMDTSSTSIIDTGSDDEFILIESKLASFDNRLKEVESSANKTNDKMIRNEIKRILLDVQGISVNLSDTKKTKMADIEEILNNILESDSYPARDDSEPIASPLIAPAR